MQIHNMSLMGHTIHPIMILRQPGGSLIMLLVVSICNFIPVLGSLGDRLPEFKECVAVYHAILHRLVG